MNAPAGEVWGLVADIGGTNARFGLACLAGGRVRIEEARTLKVADFPNLGPALRDYLAGLPKAAPILSYAALAAAGPVRDQAIRFTNSGWAFSAEAVKVEFAFAEVEILNDFTANALALPVLEPRDLAQLGPVSAPPAGAADVRLVCGPGSGFGVSALMGSGFAAQAIQGEGGHAAFAPDNEAEDRILAVLRAKYGRVSNERLLSGPGLVDLYEILARESGVGGPQRPDPSGITRAGLSGEDPVARAAILRFSAILGAVAGDFALAFGAEAGAYIAGGIVPRLVDAMHDSEFRTRFEAKGRLSYFVQPIPTFAILRGDLALVGCGARLARLAGSALDATIS